MSDDDTPGRELRAPTPVTRRLVRYVVGFGVGSVVGMAPFLGSLEVPHFRALPTLFPANMQDLFAPFAGFLIGLVVVAVQFYSEERIPRAKVRRRFFLLFLLLLVGLLLFVVFYFLFVVRVPALQGEKVVPMLIGWEMAPECECVEEGLRTRPIECIKKLSLDRARIEACWGRRSLLLSGLLLTVGYLLLTGGFVALVGLVVLQRPGKR